MASQLTREAISQVAAERVATGAADSIDAATWSITHTAGYRDGEHDARHGCGYRCPVDALEGYRAGYTRAYQWAIAYPRPASASGAVQEPAAATGELACRHGQAREKEQP